MNDASRIRAVIFDMDGVLTDSEPLINAAAVAMFKEKGLTVQPEDFREFVGTGEDRYIGGVAENYKFLIDPAAAKKRTYEIYLELVPSRLNAFPGAVELVGACQNAGLKVAVASSADRIKIDANLRKIGLPPGTWDAIVTAEDVARKKPAPDIFLAAGQKLGLTPEQCAVVEDSVNGVQAAKAAGMRCVAVAQTFPPEQLQTADLVKGRISDVTVAELTGELKSVAPGGPSPLAAVASPQPWGFWVTVGFALAIAVAFVAAQIAVAILFSTVEGADEVAIERIVSRVGNLRRGASGHRSDVVVCLDSERHFGFRLPRTEAPAREATSSLVHRVAVGGGAVRRPERAVGTAHCSRCDR